mgnify:CR=1 FL=1
MGSETAGERLAVIGDGSPIHRRQTAQEFVAGTEGEALVEPPPGDAPDLNPRDEGGRNHRKQVEMRNVVCRGLEPLHEQSHLATSRLRQKPRLVHAYFAQAGLGL